MLKVLDWGLFLFGLYACFQVGRRMRDLVDSIIIVNWERAAYYKRRSIGESS